MQTKQVAWSLDDKTVELGCERSGQGPTVLLLPALSSISTRYEMRPLQERLSENFQIVAADWPGFGDQPRPPHDWQADICAKFLTYLIGTLSPPLHAVIAAGHAATFALSHACAHPQAFSRLVLIAPTWRGPLPTMMNGRRPWFRPYLSNGRSTRRGTDALPIESAEHVYSDPGWLHGERLREKLAVTRAPGARFSSVRFVAGRLDPLATRVEFLDLARRSSVPMLIVYGSQTPPRSRSEMDALASVPGVQRSVLPLGKLSVHEEFPDLVAEAIKSFIRSGC